MKDGKRGGTAPALKWVFFLFLLALAMGWAIKSVLARSGRMKAAGITMQAFSTAAPGSVVKAVVRIDAATGRNLKATLLERVSDSVYRKPETGEASIKAVLSSETSVVMGKLQDIVPGAIVQLAGDCRRRSCSACDPSGDPDRICASCR